MFASVVFTPLERLDRARPAARTRPSHAPPRARRTPHTRSGLFVKKKAGKMASSGGSEEQRIPQAEAQESKEAPPRKDVRVAIVGNVDSGKSTLIGVLTNGGLDNGRGLARARVFAHRHESASGRTSAVSHHIVGFDENRDPVRQPVAASASAVAKNKSWREVVARSASILTFVDLAGHERYLKTTISGLTGQHPDCAVVVVGGNAGVTKMTREHLGVAVALGIPIMCVVTKTDMTPPNVLQETRKQLFRILKCSAARRTPYHVQDEADVGACVDGLSSKLCPVFFVSSVTGESLDLLTSYLSRLRPDSRWAEDRRGAPTEFVVDETFTVAGAGLVLSGMVGGGVMRENTQMLLGPFSDGLYRRVLARTLHARRTPVTEVAAGDSCAVAVRAVHRRDAVRRDDVRRGMVLLQVPPDGADPPRPVRRFEAEIVVLHHPTTIRHKYQAVVHIGMVRQTAELTTMDAVCLRTGDRCAAVFRFVVRAEHIKVGQNLLFREGTTKGVGRVTRILDGDGPGADAAPAPAETATASKAS